MHISMVVTTLKHLQEDLTRQAASVQYLSAQMFYGLALQETVDDHELLYLVAILRTTVQDLEKTLNTMANTKAVNEVVLDKVN